MGKRKRVEQQEDTQPVKQHGGRRPGAGRKPSADARREHLHIRIQPGDRERWQAAADRVGLTLSEWVRLTLNGAADRPAKRKASRKPRRKPDAMS